MLSRNVSLPIPVTEAADRFLSLVFGSVFRSLFALGTLLLVLGATVADGPLAGHLGIYGSTAILLGAVSWGITYLKLRDA